MELLYKSWDSNFFGKEIYDVLIDNDDLTHGLTIPTKREAMLQANVSISEYLKTTFLLREGFDWVSTTICFRKTLTPITGKRVMLLKASKDDINEVRRFLPGMYKHSRFFCDKYYPADAADRLYDEWVVKSYDGSYDDGILVYKENDRVGGFVTYRKNLTFLRIGLFGVNPEFQGKGLGSKIIDSLEGMCASSAIKEIQVDTQQLNNSAVKIYVRNGYDICDIRPWMYKRV
jgi:GNAT superfamily N-acetyltransferase